MSNTSTHSSTRRLAEGGICIALPYIWILPDKRKIDKAFCKRCGRI